MSERRAATRKLRLLGPVIVRRFLYQEPGHAGRAPADAGLRLSDDGFSMGVRREVARLCATDAYAPAVETLERLTGTHVAQRQAEELARRAPPRAIEQFYRHRDAEPVPDEAFLVLSFDAAGIVMRPPSLRPVTQRKAERAPPDGLPLSAERSRAAKAQSKAHGPGRSHLRDRPVRPRCRRHRRELTSLTRGECLEGAARPVRPRPGRQAPARQRGEGARM